MESPRTLVHARRPDARDGRVGQTAELAARGLARPVRAPDLERSPPRGRRIVDDGRRRARRPEQGPPAVAGELVLGRYRLLERLGSGGFGVVWRARDELLQREVAVKRIPLEPGGDSERASREALASARLAHPAIVGLYEACAVGEAFYLISELVDGETLAEVIASRALAEGEVIEIGIALADALSHAHSRGVIHRDVKPQNILVPRSPEPGGAAKLTDFGGARLAGEDVLTRTGDVLGTLAYMAPEQSEGREAGEAADLYALALVLYESLCGVNPVRGPTPAATVRRIGGELAPLASCRGDLPRALTHAIDAALVPSPPDRGTLEELCRALEDARERAPRRLRMWPGRRRTPSLVGDGERAGTRQNTRALHTAGTPTIRAPEGPGASGRGASSQGASLREAAPEPHTPAPQQGVREGESLGTEAPRTALPRAVWLGCASAAILWQVLAGRPGVALLVLAALAPLAALPRRAGPGWLVCALGPVLGLVGLANAFPALAGQAARWRRRAALGALGYWWLRLAEPLLVSRLWLGPPTGTPARAVWEGSLASAAVHVVAPLLTLGILFGAALWAAGAVLLPVIVRGRRALLDAVGAVIWAAALVLAEPAVAGGLSGRALHPDGRGAVLGAALGAAIAVAARALRGPV